MKILIAYDSLSGNTREASRLVREGFVAAGHSVAEICVTRSPEHPELIGGTYDLLLLGTWTGGVGRTPAGMKRFIEKLTTLENRPKDIALFGTGETQWGLDQFCGALDRIARFFRTDYPLLKLEQMPGTERHLREIADWVRAVLHHKKDPALAQKN